MMNIALNPRLYRLREIEFLMIKYFVQGAWDSFISFNDVFQQFVWIKMQVYFNDLLIERSKGHPVF